MKISQFLIFTATLQLASASAHASCSFSVSQPVFCVGAKTAVVAYGRFFSREGSLESYEKQLLLEAQCFQPPSKIIKGADIAVMSRGRVAMSDGWGRVALIVGNKFSGYVDERYINGACDKFKPETSVLPLRN